MSGISDIVASNIKSIREGRKMTYVELSSRLTVLGQPIPVLGLSRIERRERRVDVDDLVALAEVFGVRPEELLTPFECPQCHGTPPAGFTCKKCGSDG